MPGLVCTSCYSLGFECPSQHCQMLVSFWREDAQSAAFRIPAHCEAVSCGGQREQKPFCHMLASVKYQRLFSLVHHRHPWGETNWPGQALPTSRHPSQSLFTYHTSNSHWISHPPPKSGLRSLISQVLKKGQLCDVACHHCQVSPHLCQTLGQRLSKSPAVLVFLETSGQGHPLFGPPPNSAMSQKSNHWK